MTIEQCDKLVRDYIPEIICRNGDIPICHTICDQKTILKYLSKKLLEETDEFLQEFHLSELVDLLDVIEAFAIRLGYSSEQIATAQRAKKESNGGFEKYIVLESVIRKNAYKTK